jgi:hypothetical protein
MVKCRGKIDNKCLADANIVCDKDTKITAKLRERTQDAYLMTLFSFHKMYHQT